MKRLTLLIRRTFPVLLFVIAFLPRVLQPVSRPLVWYLRSAHFIDAILAGDWANTVYSEHPGVALMWPVGIGLRLYWAISADPWIGRVGTILGGGVWFALLVAAMTQIRRPRRAGETGSI